MTTTIGIPGKAEKKTLHSRPTASTAHGSNGRRPPAHCRGLVGPRVRRRGRRCQLHDLHLNVSLRNDEARRWGQPCVHRPGGLHRGRLLPCQLHDLHWNVYRPTAQAPRLVHVWFPQLHRIRLLRGIVPDLQRLPLRRRKICERHIIHHWRIRQVRGEHLYKT